MNNALLDSEMFLEAKKASAQASGNATDTAPSAGTAKLDSTLRPKNALSRAMSLEEFTQWFTRFEAYLDWNQKALENRTEKSNRQLLDDCLDFDLAATLSTDERVTQDTPIKGANGCLERLREFYLEDHPLFLCRHLFQECVQSQGESFKIWWTKKKAKAK